MWLRLALLLVALAVTGGPSLADAVRVTLRVDGQTRILDGDPTETVGDLVSRVGVTLGAWDRVYPRVWGEVYDGLEINVVRVAREECEQLWVEDYAIEFIDDPSLPWRSARSQESGWQNGSSKRWIHRWTRDDGLVEEVTVREEVLTTMAPRVFRLGTRGKPASPPAYCGEERVMSATGYSSEEPGLSTHTALGLRAGHGIVAVDPSVIPYGTRVWVEDYGWAVAGDCGGAIKGERIDLCFDTLREAQTYGRRNVRVRFAW